MSGVVVLIIITVVAITVACRHLIRFVGSELILAHETYRNNYGNPNAGPELLYI